MTGRRYLLFLVITCGLVSLAVVFRQVLLVDILLPLATVAWLFLRIFVLSIDQQIYWWSLILLVVLLALNRLLGESRGIEPESQPDANPALERVGYWQEAIRSNVHSTRGRSDVQKALADLLLSACGSGQQVLDGSEIESTLQARQIALPEPVHAFLVAGTTPAPRPGFFRHPIGFSRHGLRSLGLAVNRWRHRFTGRETAEYYAGIDGVITLIENSLEAKDSHERFGNVDNN